MPKNKTKLILAKELNQMLKTMSIDKIHVSQLCRRSHVLPATFYYHFHDKYDLVSWIFRYDLYQALPVDYLEFNAKNMRAIYQRFTDRKWFYKQTFRDASQNALSFYIQHFIETITKDAFAYANKRVTDYTAIGIKLYSYGIIGLIYEWTRSDKQINENAFIKTCNRFVPKSVKSIFQTYPLRRIGHVMNAME